MGYAVSCPNCKKVMNSDEHPDLKKAKCPECGQEGDWTPGAVPPPSTSPEAPQENDNRQGPEAKAALSVAEAKADETPAKHEGKAKEARK